MFVPAATAWRTARKPEWASVPSPMFWKRCGSLLNIDAPTHCTPSPPICVVPTARSRVNSAMPWQPIPPPATDPSGTTVDRLCGHPEQKYGVRGGTSSAATAMRDRAAGGGARDRRGARAGAAAQRRRRSTSSTPPDGHEAARRRVALARDPRCAGACRRAATSPAPRGTPASPRRRRSRRGLRRTSRTVGRLERPHQRRLEQSDTELVEVVEPRRRGRRARSPMSP